MGEVPYQHAVLSEHFQERMKARRLRSAVFLTYQLDPAFFEQEILPVFLDVPLSHAAVIRLVQLEDALRGLRGEVAVYYDANGLVPGDAGSAKLDIRRIPVQHRTGVFHAKNAFLLVEAEEADEDGHYVQALIVASLSANLTRAGWWENLEACQVEEIGEGEKTRLKNDLASFLDGLRRKASADGEHRALREILAFLRRVSPRLQKSSGGHLHTHFFAGTQSLPDFLAQTAGDLLRGTYLEVISPFFDDALSCQPLETLIERFRPKKVRVFLPRSAGGEGLCRPEFYEAVRALPGVGWGRLPKGSLRLGPSDDAGERFVHAKVYRFFTQSPKRELCFVGSANLTTAAHQTGGNVETGFLVDFVPPRQPDFWLIADDRPPAEFLASTEDQDAATSGGTHLNLRYHWDRAVAEAFWDAPGGSRDLLVKARGVEVGVIPPLPPRVWTPLAAEIAQRIADHLVETSLFEVYGGNEGPAFLLVQEEGMSHKPSLLLQLSVADILRYWSLLTPEQRAAFVEARAPEVALTGQGADLVTRPHVLLEADTLFDRFAGIFHGFGCLERTVRAALDAKREKETDYRLFGKKYDSLTSLLNRAASPGESCDEIEAYVIVGCAHQLCQEIASGYPDYWSSHEAPVKELTSLVNGHAVAIRKKLIDESPPGFERFLDWFDPRFRRRAEPVGKGQA